MHAVLRHIRIAPKKANLVASLVRGRAITDAMAILERTPKKSARILERVLHSAVANAEHNAGQHREDLYVKRLLVHRGKAYRRGIPMARGRVRPIDKFTSHIVVDLGILVPEKTPQERGERQRTPRVQADSLSP